MDMLSFDVSEYLIVKYVLLGLLLVGVLIGLRKGLHLIQLKPTTRERIDRSLPLVEALMGLIFIVLAAHSIFQNQPTYFMVLFSAILVILVWSFWFAIQDFVSGLILKWEDTYTVGDLLTVESETGRVIRVGYRSLMIETADGQRIKFPYSHLTRTQVHKLDADEVVWAHTFQMAVPLTDAPEVMMKRIILAATNVVWSAVNRVPQVVFQGVQNGVQLFEITVYVLDPNRRSTIESRIRESLGNT